MIDRGIIASYLLSPLSKITNLETTTQFKLVKDHYSNRVNDLLIHNTIPVALHNNLFTFRDTNKRPELDGDLIKMITNKNYNVDLASLSVKKLMYDFAKETHFHEKSSGSKRTRNRTLIKLLDLQGLMISAFGFSNTIISSSNPDKLCKRLKLLIQEKQG